VNGLLEAVAAELERPRELSQRVLNYISDTYDVDPDDIGKFLVEELPKLEDYEIDLILSPVFTPKLADQAVFAELLGKTPVPREQWAELVQKLVAHPIRAQLVTPDGASHAVALREVSIERYVHRLRLEAAIPESVFNLLERLPADTDRPMLRAIARRSAWESAGSREILEGYLEAITTHGGYDFADMLELLNLAETRKPANIPDLLASIPKWADTLREQIDKASAPKPFFHQQVEYMHGLGRDQRAPDESRASAKENELRFLLRLQTLLSQGA
jgi:hypothetical protein